jgi:hypothetical protein
MVINVYVPQHIMMTALSFVKNAIQPVSLVMQIQELAA